MKLDYRSSSSAKRASVAEIITYSIIAAYAAAIVCVLVVVAMK